jgi:hypothetical protein
VRGVVRAVIVLTGVVVIGIGGVTSWRWVEGYLNRRAFTAYMEAGKARAARRLEEIGNLPGELRESSGLAVSRRRPGVLWSHNDSGDAPNLYAIDLSGRLLATVPVTGASAQDWEDMSAGPCPPGVTTSAPVEDRPEKSSCLFVADTGNNNLEREILTIYILAEPWFGPGAQPSSLPARSVRYRYPDRPHNAEALAVLPTGEVTLVTKDGTGTADLFALSAVSIARALVSGEVLTAEDTGNTGIEPDAQISRLVTGAAVSPDGKTLAVRTYNEVFFYSSVDGGQGKTRWRRAGQPCFLGDAEPQGEAIAYLDATTLLLTSETSRGRRGTLHRLQC